MKDFSDALWPETASARSKSGRLSPAMPVAPMRRKLRRLIPSQNAPRVFPTIVNTLDLLRLAVELKFLGADHDRNHVLPRLSGQPKLLGLRRRGFSGRLQEVENLPALLRIRRSAESAEVQFGHFLCVGPFILAEGLGPS